MRYFSFIVLVLLSNYSFAQNLSLPNYLNVFVDCNNYGSNCFSEFIRQEMNAITFVRDRKDADVHIILKDNRNSAGIQQNTMFVIGQNRYSAIQDTINYTIPANSTEQETRDYFTKYIKLSLTPFVLKTTLVNQVTMNFEKDTTSITANQTAQKDPYDYWVFQLGINGYMNGNQVFKEVSGSGYATANRETNVSKSNIYFNANEQYSKYTDVENDTVYIYEFQEFSLGGSSYKKMTDHVALGIQGDFSNSIFRNLKYQFTVGPVVEFSLFPYKDFNSKRLVLQYAPDIRHATFYDTTIYLKTKQLMFSQEAALIGSYTQKWGSVNAGIFWRNLFTDFSKNSLGFNGAITARLFKGLNFAIWGNYSFIRNQMSIRKGDASIDQLLAKNREILSAYDYNLGIGFSYRFGSKFNDAVNPTFRGLNYNISL